MSLNHAAFHARRPTLRGRACPESFAARLLIPSNASCPQNYVHCYSDNPLDFSGHSSIRIVSKNQWKLNMFDSYQVRFSFTGQGIPQIPNGSIETSHQPSANQVVSTSGNVFNALIDAYILSPEWMQLADRTRYTWAFIVERTCHRCPPHVADDRRLAAMTGVRRADLIALEWPEVG